MEKHKKVEQQVEKNKNFNWKNQRTATLGEYVPFFYIFIEYVFEVLSCSLCNLL